MAVLRRLHDKRLIAILLVLALFVMLLLLWVRRGASDDVSYATPRDGATPKSAVVPSTRPSESGSPSASSPSAEATEKSRNGLIPDLPESTLISPAGLPRRAVVITVTSDATLLGFGYKVAYGKSSKSISYNVASPVRVEAVARGYGLLAAVGAQSGPGATYLTCSVSVDGKVHSTHTVHGGYNVAVCLG